jgi:cytochrome c peroxidase
MTYPYFHEGSAETLKEADSIMGESQLGRTFNDDEVEKMGAILKSLTREFPVVTHPTLPR